MKKIVVVLLITLFCMSFLFAVEEKEKGPFGTKWLYSKEEMEKVGTLTLAEDCGDYSLCYFEPINGHSAFDRYLVIMLDDVGLVKLVAIGKDIKCSSYGTALKSAYSDMKNSLMKAYGPVTKEYDFNTSSLWTEADDWMHSLYYGYRYLTCYWEMDNYTVGLDSEASDSSTGNISVTYEHEKWGEYLERKNASEEGNL